MQYILDVDRTLFDTDRFKQDSESYKRDGVWESGIWNQLNPKDYLYDDVIPFLTSLDKESVGILTVIRDYLGDKGVEFQKGKVELTGVSELVSWCEYMKGEKGEYVAERCGEEQMVFIDDEPGQIDSVHEHCPEVISILLDRKGKAADDFVAGRSNIHIVRELSEVSAILEQYG